MRSETVIGQARNARPRARRRPPFFRDAVERDVRLVDRRDPRRRPRMRDRLRGHRRRGDRRRRHHDVGRAPQPLVQRELVAGADPGCRGLHACRQRPVADPLAAVAVGILAWRRAWADALLVAMATAGALVINPLFKEFFSRPRPAIHDPDLTLRTFSFPSGHAMGSAAVYGALAIVLARRLRGTVWAPLVVAAAVLIVLLVGASRVYLGVALPDRRRRRVDPRACLAARLRARADDPRGAPGEPLVRQPLLAELGERAVVLLEPRAPCRAARAASFVNCTSR